MSEVAGKKKGKGEEGNPSKRGVLSALSRKDARRHRCEMGVDETRLSQGEERGKLVEGQRTGRSYLRSETKGGCEKASRQNETGGNTIARLHSRGDRAGREES